MMKISFVGDISFNDDYIRFYEEKKHPFSEVASILETSDLVIGNLECMAEGNEGENEFRKPRLKTTTQTLNYLNEIGINVVSLANNHVYDNLTDGFKKTTDFLTDNNIKYVGAGLSESEACKPLVLDIKNQRIGILAYVSKDTNPCLNSNAGVYLNYLDEQNVINDISSIKGNVDYIILLLHWGGNFENGYYPDFHQPGLAKEFLNSGADIIVGHHSHTLQPYEKYNGKYVFYSLGNFCFSDITFENKTKKIVSNSRFTESIILNLHIKHQHTEINMVPIKNKNLILKPYAMAGFKLKFRKVWFLLIIKHMPFWYFYKIYFQKVFPYIIMLKNFKQISFVKKYFNQK